MERVFEKEVTVIATGGMHKERRLHFDWCVALLFLTRLPSIVRPMQLHRATTASVAPVRVLAQSVRGWSALRCG